ncbi:Tfp pilus assembly protein PilV [Inhella inkyongensis]|uniref:Tfp pilus assembly protein PilV n=1 Tax=Inhella inkyongensis TaxID=392593 RepID=A0A840S6U7_9BURK|nr:hypothetical protein [Inhella inkyongensis]MBB5204189.1 Tfp pilus assembly protein PilV [Inhella inkyongensis]
MKSSHPLSIPRERGTTLIEALVALLVMAFGMLAIAGLTGRLRHSGEYAKQRVEAAQILRAENERLRGFVAMSREAATPAGSLVYDELIADTADRTVTGAATTYTIKRSFTPVGSAGVGVRLAVSWTDRQSQSGKPHELVYESDLPATDPRLFATAYVPPEDGSTFRRPQNRHPAIPQAAKSLDNGSSVFKPQPGGTAAWVFNNRTGLITSFCTVSASSPTSSLSLADLASCTTVAGSGAFLLSGHIRFSMLSPPDSESPSSPVLPLGMEVTLTSSVHALAPHCVTDPVSNPAAGVEAVDYYCAVYPRTETVGDKLLYWSGRSRLTGLNLAAGGQRVCRYSSDYDGNGRIGNPEHPLDYSRVSESLAHQNFLVIRFEDSCPSGHGVNLSAGQFSNTVTLAHQP